MNATARWILGALVLSLPALIALAVFADGGVAPHWAFLAALLVYLAELAILWPLAKGIAAVHRAVDTMAANAAAAGDGETLSPAVRELWLAVGRGARAWRQKLQTREQELSAAQTVLAALPDPLILL